MQFKIASYITIVYKCIYKSPYSYPILGFRAQRLEFRFQGLGFMGAWLRVSYKGFCFVSFRSVLLCSALSPSHALLFSHQVATPGIFSLFDSQDLICMKG